MSDNDRVRILQWQHFDAFPSEVNWEARTPFGVYIIEQYFGSDSYGFECRFGAQTICNGDDPEDAKQAAQADFERRILASLAPSQPSATGLRAIKAQGGIVKAALNVLGDRRLLNDVDDDLHQEIGQAVFDAIRSALDAAGYVIAPVEPSWEAKIAGRDAINGDEGDIDVTTDDARACWSAMLAAFQQERERG